MAWTCVKEACVRDAIKAGRGLCEDVTGRGSKECQDIFSMYGRILLEVVLGIHKRVWQEFVSGICVRTCQEFVSGLCLILCQEFA